MAKAKTGHESGAGLSLTQSTVIPVLALSSVVVAILLVSQIVGSFATLDRLYMAQSQLMQESFTQEVSQDILLGLHGEVFRRCQNLMASGFVDQVRITTAAGDEICGQYKHSESVRPERVRVLRSEVTFSKGLPSRAAAQIEVTYNLSEMATEERRILWLSLVAIGVVVASSIAIYFLLRGWIVMPLLRIRESLKESDVAALERFLRPMVLTVRELRGLRDGLVDLAERIVEYQRKEIETRSRLAAAETAQQVAHDIRSPLSAVNLIAGKLRARGEPEAELLSQAARRGQEVADDVLSATRESAGVGSRVKIPLVIGDLRSCIESMAADLVGGQVRLSAEVGQVEAAIRVNRSHLKRMMDNLLQNSVESKAPDRGLEVAIFVRCEGNYLVISVRDNGKGIAPDILARLGKEQITSGKADGTGLGLLGLFRRVRDWQGEVQIESQLNQGTVVSIRLPLLG